MFIMVITDYPEQCDSQGYGRPNNTDIDKLTDQQARRLEELHVHQVNSTDWFLMIDSL